MLEKINNLLSEIEEFAADSKEQVEEALRLLGLEWQDVGDMGMIEIYQNHGLDLHSFKELKFEK